MNKKAETDQNRRDFIKKAAYIAPAVLTMAAVPSFASAGSGYDRSRAHALSAPVASGPRVHRRRK